MNFDDAFERFKAKYSSTPRVISIVQNEFGTEDITVLYYDKFDKSPPITIDSWEGHPLDVRGVMPLKEGFEFIYDQIVSNDPNSWELNAEVMCSWNYKNICNMISNYELGKD
jgi:hypothetical protein